jgi:hypothetical protein
VLTVDDIPYLRHLIQMEYRRTDWSTIPYGAKPAIDNKPIDRDAVMADVRKCMLEQADPNSKWYYANRREEERFFGTVGATCVGKTLLLSEVARNVPQPLRERAVTLFFSFSLFSSTQMTCSEIEEAQRNEFVPLVIRCLLWSYFSGLPESWVVFNDLRFSPSIRVIDVLDKLVELEYARRPWTDEAGKPFFVFCFYGLAHAQHAGITRSTFKENIARIDAVVDQFIRNGCDKLAAPKFVLFSLKDLDLWARVMGGVSKDKKTGQWICVGTNRVWHWFPLNSLVL